MSQERIMLAKSFLVLWSLCGLCVHEDTWSLSLQIESLGCHMVDEELGVYAAYSVLLGRWKNYT